MMSQETWYKEQPIASDILYVKSDWNAVKRKLSETTVLGKISEKNFTRQKFVSVKLLEAYINKA